MSNTGKQSPLGANTLASLLLNQGLGINPSVISYAGKSKVNSKYIPGSIVNNTCLKLLTYAINNAYNRGEPSATGVMIDSSIEGTTLTVGTLVNGDIKIGMVLTGTGISPGTTIVSNIESEGTGSKWTVNISQTVINITITGTMPSYTVSNSTYDYLLSIGQSRIPALGNSKPPTYIANDPSGSWSGEATTGFSIPGVTGQGQLAKWVPYNTTNPNRSITQWGWIRNVALQSWYDFNWGNRFVEIDNPEYKFFLQFTLLIEGFMQQSNDSIITLRNSLKFLEGTYSNMNDLITADITGVSLSTQAFGQDLINLGKALYLPRIDSFGSPATLLYTLQLAGAVSDSVTMALLGVGFTENEINEILTTGLATAQQEQKLYDAFANIINNDLLEILQVIKCKTKGLTRLSDLLNVKKLFPISYTTLTVPVYNTIDSPTNSKIYYLLFVNEQLNPQLLNENLIRQIPKQVPALPPVIVPDPAEPVQEVEEQVFTTPAPPIPPQPLPTKPAGGGGGGCVALESYIPLVETKQKHNGKEITKAWMLESGMKISLGTDNLEIVDGSVVKTLNDYQPCIRISTSDGIALVCSTTAPIYTKEKGFIPATEVYGKRVAVMRNGRTWYDEVVGLEDVGMKFVRVIDAGNNSFWAGERPGAFILHHNVPINDTLNYEKK